ncbi:uncharacterized protein CXQ87_000828 [Candidozyma duobushaemuli]|uniref:Uncharacterized protein n=2 Tax=Candidozyma TaxID=3303203 RepID=A0ABX8I3P4_9ASCO|nr:uncharacterized protein CXQ87_000828 [[Candida] duobushaemulonis]PVH17927.1 hypothetical protein CXQ87_000828 [[Candida] duobushaemulonis]QWU86508.1 hypothetical protein CA3LBN_000726 [[Candida] haemuloni]
MSIPYNINAAKPAATMEGSLESQEKNRRIPLVYGSRNGSPNPQNYAMGTPSPPLTSLSNRMLNNSMVPSPLTLPPQQGMRANHNSMLSKSSEQTQHNQIQHAHQGSDQMHRQQRGPTPQSYQEYQQRSQKETNSMMNVGDFQHNQQQHQIHQNHNSQVPHYASPQMFSKQGQQQHLAQGHPPFEYGQYQHIQPLGQQMDQSDFHQYSQHQQQQPNQDTHQVQSQFANHDQKSLGASPQNSDESEGKHKITIVTKFVPATEDDGSKKKRGRPKKYILDPATNEFIDSSHENFKRLNKLLKESTKTTSKKLGDAEQHVGIVKGTSLKSLNDVAVQQLLEKKDKRGRPRKFPIEKTGLTIRGVRVSGTGRGPSEKAQVTASNVAADTDKVSKKKRGRPKREESVGATVQ